MRFLPFFVKHIATVIQIHPAFIALKNNLNNLLLVVKRLNEYYNPLIDSVQQDDLLTDSKQDRYYFADSTQEDSNADNPVCKDDSFLRDAVLVTSIVTFAVVVIRCIWNSRSAEKRRLKEIQVEKTKTFTQDECFRLKELNKIILCLKHYLKVLPENRRTNPFILNSVTDTVREVTNRSLYSNVSRKPVAENDMDRQENYEKLRENLQKAIFILEEQIDYKSKKVGGAEADYRDVESSMEDNEVIDDVCHPPNPIESKPVTRGPGASHTDMRRLLKLPNSNPTMFLLQKQMDVKSLVTDDADKHKPTDPCKECSKMKEALVLLKRQLDNKPFRPNVMTDCNIVDTLKLSSKSNETQNSMVCSMPSSDQKICDCKTMEMNKQATANSEWDIQNVISNKNTLNIEILFNRNIQLDKIRKDI